MFLSQDIVSAVALLGVFGSFRYFGSYFEGVIATGMRGLLGTLARAGGEGNMARAAADMAAVMAWVMLPILAVSLAIPVAVTFIQTRFLVSPAQIAPKFSRISPIAGFQKLFSIRSLVESVKSILKISLILGIIFLDLYPNLTQVQKLYDVSVARAVGWIGGLFVDVGLKAGVVLLIIGVGDFFYQWWDFEHNIMMTKQEVKEEFKQTEGNPEIKNRLRQLRRRLSRMRMMHAVKKASVVVRNPTHYAVAILYDEKRNKAPLVVAKGQGDLALRIVKVAQENHVYVTENRPLAQALYKSVEIGTEIPREFYRAVAEVLAYIYRMKRSGRTG